MPSRKFSTYSLRLATLAGLCALTPVTHADTILGIFVGTSQWSTDFSGDIASGGPKIDLEDQLNLDGESTRSLYVALEHPIPGLPNIKYRQVDLDSSSVATLSQQIVFDGVTYNVNDTVTSNFDLSHNNYIFYYEVLDNWVNLDLGINLIDFDGEVALSTTGSSSRAKLDEMIPTAYVKARFDFPTTNFYAGFETSLLSVGDNSLQEQRYNIGWENDFGLGIEAGYRSFSLEWDDLDDSDGDLAFDGYYASIYYHF